MGGGQHQVLQPGEQLKVIEGLVQAPQTVDAEPQPLLADTLPRLPARAQSAHKGQFGHVLLIGGDRGFGGSITLSAQSALRCGAGLVSLATRPEHVPAALTRLPEVMTLGVLSANQLMGVLAQASVVVVGPGLGQAAWGRSVLSAAAQAKMPQVWDADALNLLSNAQFDVPSGSVLTPHPGEAAHRQKPKCNAPAKRWPPTRRMCNCAKVKNCWPAKS